MLERILEVIDDIKNGTAAPALIHCESGSGRTGLVCALYMIETERATLEQALDELDAYKYFHIEELYPNVKHFIRLWFDLRKNKKLNKEAALEAYKKIYSDLPLIKTI
jgi:protein-tyrosine phosphatase